MSLPSVTDMVPLIWYPLMSRHTAGSTTHADQLRDMHHGDLASIIKALPEAERTELLAPYARISDDAWFDQEKARGLVMTERDSLQSQLSAALAEKEEVLGKVAAMERENDGWIATERDLAAARETIRKLEAQLRVAVDDCAHAVSTREKGWERAKVAEAALDSVCSILYNTGATRGDAETRAKRAVETHRESREELATAEETIRALAEERDRLEARAGVDANRIRRFESREAPGEEWKRAMQFAGTHVSSWLNDSRTADAVRKLPYQPYEPPRSEEGRPDEVDQIRKELNVEALDAQGARLGLHGTTRLAPLTDRERAIVAAAEKVVGLYGRTDGGYLTHRKAREEAQAELRAAVDLPKTPDVRREDYHDQRIAEAGYVPASERDELREKLRLATEQVEALRRVAHAAKVARYERSDLSLYAANGNERFSRLGHSNQAVYAYKADFDVWQASDEYEAKRK